MEPAQTERIIGLVEEALAQPAAERSAFLDRECGADAAVRAEVESLLRFEKPASAFIENPAIAINAAEFLQSDPEPPATQLAPGDQLGDCRIVALLGGGGMGEVYLAEDLGLGGRKVALKLVKSGMASDSLVRNFRQERLILAELSHPHIARLYGAAVTASGAPYFAMEYIEGERIDAFCDRRRLTVEQRLVIFQKVCAAVSHAHQRLIVHRDLKPANILVTPEGEPKLLDFGIAKLLAPNDGNPVADQTVTLLAALTPAYASPEQLQGASITTAADIYSLGILLYELLSGCRPHRSAHEENLEKPSVAVRRLGEQAAAARGVKPARLVRQLTGDLDNIVLTAARPEPERRYRSVDQFAEDIRRHLDGRPVTARRETWRYVGARFIRRHRAAAAVALLLALSLIGGILATSWQARRAQEQRERAERRFNEVRRLANSLLFEINESVQPLPGSIPTRQLIVTRALQYLDGLARDADSPALRLDLANAYERIGDIQGNPFTENLGNTDGALASYRKAQSLRASVGATTPANRLAQARSERSLGDILEVKGDFAAMIEHYRRSLELLTHLHDEDPKNEEVRDEYVRAYDVLGDGLSRLPNSDAEKLASYEKTLALRQEMLREHPQDRRARRSAATTMGKVGLNLTADLPRGAALVRESVEMLRALSAEQPDSARARREYGWGVSSLANVQLAAQDFEGALRTEGEALQIYEKIVAGDPQNTQAQLDLGSNLGGETDALLGLQQFATALETSTRAAVIFDQLVRAAPDSAIFARNLGVIEKKIGRAEEALAATDSAKRAEHLAHAIDADEKALAIFSDFDRKRAQRPEDADNPRELTEKIAALKALSAAAAIQR